MATSPLVELIHQLRRTELLSAGAGSTDGQLLERFISRRDEAALATIVQRHGPMVWGVCRRVLGDYHDAEDAFQATFLVLVRKATSVRPREMVANWLYGVARQTALKARATVGTRRGRERQVAEMPEPAVAEPAGWDELLPVLDVELRRLPDKYRAVVVLCDLEGKSRKEAARQLGVPEGTVAGWVARARVMLANRLTRRGVTLSGGALAAILSQNVASAGVPSLVVANTIKVASLSAAGQATTGVIPVTVAALTGGVLRAMFVTKIRSVLAVVLVALACIGGGMTVTPMVMGKQPDGPKKPDDKKDAVADTKSELAKLQGVWAVASYEIEGEKLPGIDNRSSMTIVGDKWVSMWVEDDEHMRAECGILKITDPEKSPLAVDFVHLDGQHKGSTVFAIVRADGDTFKFCYRVNDANARPTEFKTKVGDTSGGLVTFNRQKK
jgi:RNA polymerase sigma factor (sigma-70 family)